MKNYINAMQQMSVLVIGDIMLDRFVYGTIDRISPESDAPVLAVRREDEMPGGAGNVVSNLRALNVQTRILAVIGKDEAGKTLETLADKTDIFIVSKGRPTTVKTRFVTAGRQLLRADKEITTPISETEETALLEKAKALIPAMQAIILSDYNKGVLTERVIKSIITMAQEESVPVLADPKKPDYKIYEGASIITPNRKELSEVTNMPADTDEEITAAAHKLMSAANITQLIVTRSEDGMTVFEGDAPPVHVRNDETPEVFDVSGAGDTAIATLAAAIATGAPLSEAAHIANKAGGLVVAKTGTATIKSEELNGALDGIKVNTRNPREAFTCDWNDAAKEIQSWQDQGLQIGFTNGCFDILHYGHVNYLNRARDKCDRLVVALNHDKSVKILKGETRPLHDQNSRAAVLGSLSAVDMIVFFGAETNNADNTPCALIEKIRPNIYFKGGDYTIDQLPEAKIMSSFGGKTEIMPLYEGHSTTATIAKMNKDEAA